MTAQPRTVRQSPPRPGSAVKLYDFLLCGLLAALRWSDCIRRRAPRTPVWGRRTSPPPDSVDPAQISVLG